jgi:drug/metabolite transporter (DMT)-like permease
MTRIWIFYSLVTAAMLGFSYVAGEILYARISFVTVLVVANISGAVVLCLVSWQTGRLATDFRDLSWTYAGWLAAFAVAWTLVEIFASLAITNKNAALASIIEVSYPLFVVAFSAIMIGGRPLTPSVIIGAVLIFSGVAVIAIKAP